MSTIFDRFLGETVLVGVGGSGGLLTTWAAPWRGLHTRKGIPRDCKALERAMSCGAAAQWAAILYSAHDFRVNRTEAGRTEAILIAR